MRLNVGCGRFRVPGYVNVDMAFAVRPDVVADAARLPFADGVFDRIYAGHALEHFEFWPCFLCEANRVLRDGGELAVVVPVLVDGGDESVMLGVALGDVLRGEYHVGFWTADIVARVAPLFGFAVSCHAVPGEVSVIVEWQDGIVLRKVGGVPRRTERWVRRWYRLKRANVLRIC